MSKTKNNNKQTTLNTPPMCDEPRFACTNWTPNTRVAFNGKKKLARKVITTGTWHIDADDIIEEAKEHLRMGEQVYIGSGILLQPMMEKNLSGIYVSARTVGEFYACLSDKKAVVTHCGEELDDEGVDEMIETQRRRRAEYEHRGVTPDTIVTCPKCGNRFRVGKRESED